MNQTDIRLPSGPRGRWGPSLSFMRDARGSLEKWIAEFGDPFLINALNGPIVITARPDLISKIFGSDPIMFETFAKATIDPILGKDSMLSLDGEAHRRERKLIMPMFHGQRMRSYAETIQQSAIGAFEANVDVGTVAMHDITTDISLEVIVKALLGADDERAANDLINKSQKVLKLSLPIFFFSSKSQFRLMGLSPWDRFERARKDLRAAINQIIEKLSLIHI